MATVLHPKTASKSTNALPRLGYTMRETSQMLGVSYMTIHRLLKRGMLKSCSVLRTKLIPRDEIDRFLRETVRAEV